MNYGREQYEVPETRCDRAGRHLSPRALTYERDARVTVARMVCDECGARWTKEEGRR